MCQYIFWYDTLCRMDMPLNLVSCFLGENHVISATVLTPRPGWIYFEGLIIFHSLRVTKEVPIQLDLPIRWSIRQRIWWSGLLADVLKKRQPPRPVRGCRSGNWRKIGSADIEFRCVPYFGWSQGSIEDLTCDSRNQVLYPWNSLRLKISETPEQFGLQSILKNRELCSCFWNHLKLKDEYDLM